MEKFSCRHISGKDERERGRGKRKERETRRRWEEKMRSGSYLWAQLACATGDTQAVVAGFNVIM